MWLHQPVRTLMVVGVLSLMIAPMPSYAQRGESDSERAYTVEGISCALFPEDCPKTRGLPQRPGSEKPTVAPAAPEPVTFHIRFATNSDEIPARYYADLDKLGQALSSSLARRPQAAIEIAGYTDSAGSQTHNQRLSERRAASVKRYLMNKFTIPSDNLSVHGYGPNDPIVPNDTPEGRQQNRRVVAGRLK